MQENIVINEITYINSRTINTAISVLTCTCFSTFFWFSDCIIIFFLFLGKLCSSSRGWRRDWTILITRTQPSDYYFIGGVNHYKYLDYCAYYKWYVLMPKIIPFGSFGIRNYSSTKIRLKKNLIFCSRCRTIYYGHIHIRYGRLTRIFLMFFPV